MSHERNEVRQGLTHSTTEAFRQRNANALMAAATNSRREGR